MPPTDKRRFASAPAISTSRDSADTIPINMTTTELKSARIQWMAARVSLAVDVYLTAVNDPDELEKAITIAEQFIAASKNLIQELRQKEGVAP
jgi:hypothetical protein